MPWQIDLLTPDGSGVIASRSEASPTGISGDLEWSCSRENNCLTASLTVNAVAFPVRGTQLVRLHVDGVPRYFGVVAEAPNPRDQSWKEVKLDGAYRLLEKRIIGPDVFENMDVGAIARALVERYRHPALAYDPALIPNQGFVLKKFSLPYRKLSQALDTLSKAVGGAQSVPFGVYPDGRVFFARQSGPSPAVAFAEVQGLTWLPVTTDEVVTRAYLVALSQSSGAGRAAARIHPPNYSGNATTVTWSGSSPQFTYQSSGLPYRPATYSSVAADPNFPDTQWEAAALAPAGADLFTDVVSSLQPQVTAMRGSPNSSTPDEITFAASDGTGANSSLQYEQAAGVDANPVIGFRVVYSLALGLQSRDFHAEVTQAYLVPYQGKDREGNPVTLYASAEFDFVLADTNGAMREVTAITPLPQEFAEHLKLGPFMPATLTPSRAIVNAGCWGISRYNEATTSWVTPNVPDDVFRIYRLELLAYDRSKGDSLARKLLVPPASVPTEFRVSRLLAPSPAYTLTGAPGGNLTGDVAEFSYRHGTGGLRSTTVKLEQPGASETARIIRLAAQTQAQEAQTQLRGYLEGS